MLWVSFMKKRLTKKQMIIFAIGQLGWSLLSGIISAWFVTFYLPSQGDIDAGATQFIVPGLIIGGFMTVLGLITALSRIFDAVTDPLIASLSDRSKNPRGRRIPFMQWAAIPLSVVTVLLFCAPVNAISGWNIAWGGRCNAGERNQRDYGRRRHRRENGAEGQSQNRRCAGLS